MCVATDAYPAAQLATPLKCNHDGCLGSPPAARHARTRVVGSLPWSSVVGRSGPALEFDCSSMGDESEGDASLLLLLRLQAGRSFRCPRCTPS